MPTVAFGDAIYSLRSRKTIVPDLAAMRRIDALFWLCQNTRPRGYQRANNPLSGFGGVISVAAR
jgi:hypothetical protein